MARRWYIERTPSDAHSPRFDDVGAESLEIHNSGALVFQIGGGEMLAYAPGTWVTVHDEVDN